MKGRGEKGGRSHREENQSPCLDKIGKGERKAREERKLRGEGGGGGGWEEE